MSRVRRGRGEGGVYRRADGRWCGSASVGYGDDGKRRRRTVYGKTKAEAVAKLDAVRQDVRAGVPVDPVKGTVADFLAFWLADDVKPNRAPGTHKCYADAVRLHVNPHVGGVRLADLDAAILVNLYATLARAGVGARTREIVHVVLRRASGRPSTGARSGTTPRPRSAGRPSPRSPG